MIGGHQMSAYSLLAVMSTHIRHSRLAATADSSNADLLTKQATIREAI